MKRLFIALILSAIFISIFVPALFALDEIDRGGSLRIIGQYGSNPNDPLLYPEEKDYRGDFVARQFLSANIREGVGFEVNIYESFSHRKSETGLSLTTKGVERCAALDTSLLSEKYSEGEGVIDRLNMRLSFERFDLTIGRQPINLATTFHFTPNDFFAPFSANIFYRVYKPGVDSLRGEVRIDNLTQLSLVAVLGYKEDSSNRSGWSGYIAEGRNSYLARLTTSIHNFEWSLLAGKVRREKILGGGMQGEIMDWLGVRGEGHYAVPEDEGGKRHSELSLGLEHRFANDFFLRLEHFYHGKGEGSLDDYALPVRELTERDYYLAERYSAMSVNYQFTPLLVGDIAYLINHIDSSYLVSFNGVYSLSDESELSAGINIPIGEEPEAGVLKSEFGLLPSSMNIEYRVYF